MIDRQLRVLAVDARRSRFGYSVFEGKDKLLDWGSTDVLSRDRDVIVAARKRFSNLLKIFTPSLVILKQGHRRTSLNWPDVDRIRIAVQLEASLCKIPVRCVGEAEIKCLFFGSSETRKDMIAKALAEVFPELLVRLPQAHKSWQSERYAIIVFDAVAAGYAYLHRDIAENSGSG